MKQLLVMLKATADWAFVVDQQGKIIFWNRAAERLLGFRAEEVIARPCHEVIRGESLCGQAVCSAHCSIAGRLACGRAVRNFDMQTRTKDGRRIWLNMSSLPFPSRMNQPWMAVHLFRDITKQAKVQKLVEELHAELCWNTPVQNTKRSKEASPAIQSELPLSANVKSCDCMRTVRTPSKSPIGSASVPRRSAITPNIFLKSLGLTRDCRRWPSPSARGLRPSDRRTFDNPPRLFHETTIMP